MPIVRHRRGRPSSSSYFLVKRAVPRSSLLHPATGVCARPLVSHLRRPTSRVPLPPLPLASCSNLPLLLLRRSHVLLCPQYPAALLPVAPHIPPTFGQASHCSAALTAVPRLQHPAAPRARPAILLAHARGRPPLAAGHRAELVEAFLPGARLGIVGAHACHGVCGIGGGVAMGQARRTNWRIDRRCSPLRLHVLVSRLAAGVGVDEM